MSTAFPSLLKYKSLRTYPSGTPDGECALLCAPTLRERLTANAFQNITRTSLNWESL